MRRFSWTPSIVPPRLSDHAQIEADPRMKCATAAPMVRMRDLSQVVEHVHDAGETKFSDAPLPPRQEPARPQ